jgi:hypothetical protein
MGFKQLPTPDQPQWLQVPSADGGPLDEGVFVLKAPTEGSEVCSAEIFLHGGFGVARGLEALFRSRGWVEEHPVSSSDQTLLLSTRSPLAAQVALARLRQTPEEWGRKQKEKGAASVYKWKSRLHAWRPWSDLLFAPPRIVLAGPPNSGKSSILNAWLQKERVTVSPHPGTTRDSIEATILLGEGNRVLEVVLVDTAGLGESQEQLDQLAQEASLRELERAWCVIEVWDLGVERGAGLALPDAICHRIHLAHREDLPHAWEVPHEDSWIVGSVFKDAKQLIREIEARICTFLPPAFPADFPLPVSEKEWLNLERGLSDI